MTRPAPLWFIALAAVALLWNLAGLFAVVSDLRLTAADIAALPAQERALRAALPLWSTAASLIAVVGGTLGSIGLLVRKRWALVALYVSLAGIILQDVSIYAAATTPKNVETVPLVLQGIVLVIAVGLIALGRKALAKSWL